MFLSQINLSLYKSPIHLTSFLGFTTLVILIITSQAFQPVQKPPIKTIINIVCYNAN
jgi:hypothetical protein